MFVSDSSREEGWGEYLPLFYKRLRGFCQNSPLFLSFAIHYRHIVIFDHYRGERPHSVLINLPIDETLSIEDTIHDIHVWLRRHNYPTITSSDRTFIVDKVTLSRNEFVLFSDDQDRDNPSEYEIYQFPENSGIRVIDWLSMLHPNGDYPSYLEGCDMFDKRAYLIRTITND
jgi:hypothetical protein